MRKRDVVERVAGEAGTTKQAAEAAVGTVFASITEALAAVTTSTSRASAGSCGPRDRPARAATRVPASASPSVRRPECRSRLGRP